jgi:sigma-B regulation protein RsbU (phosphoserine phosphatase)
MNSAERCLLLVDNDDVERANIAALLKNAGFNVCQATDGKEGLSMITRLQPALVLCDLNTPNIDGQILLEAIKAESADIPVIVISSVGVMDDVVQALRFGAGDYLIKPIVDSEMLLHSINRCIERRRLREENRQYRSKLEKANRGLKRSLQELEQDQQAGKQVQMKMRPPRCKQYGEYLFSNRIVPSLLLSGDFVDYFKVGDDHMVFVIADVSGHGASSAFITVLLKNMFARKRSHYLHRDDATILSPAGMLDVANRNLLNTEIGKHATMCVGVIDLKTDVLHYSVAGHLPLPVLNIAGECRYLPCEGVPVGLFADATYNEQSISLPDSFELTLFSDGILEVLPVAGLIEQEKYLLEKLKTGASTIDKVMETLQVNEDFEGPDDTTVLLITKNSGS